MEFIPVDSLEGLEEDLRVVSVIWRGDKPRPIFDYSGMSPYEAAGLLRAALIRLDEENAEDITNLDDAQDEEAEEEEDDED